MQTAAEIAAQDAFRAIAEARTALAQAGVLARKQIAEHHTDERSFRAACDMFDALEEAHGHVSEALEEQLNF